MIKYYIFTKMTDVKSLKKKRVSKKNKFAWRKYSNIDDVEDYLEEKRVDERLGGSLDLVEDEKLFWIDTKPKKDVKKKKEFNVPRCFQVLYTRSKVSDPITKRNRVRTKEERKSLILKNIEANRRLQGIKTQREILANLNRYKNKIRKRESTYKRREFKNDIWEVEDNNLALLKSEWNNSDTVRHNLQGLGKLRKEIPKSVTQKPSIIPTIEYPHPGTSYNPSYTDHQDLLKQIVEKENEIIKKVNHLARVTTNIFPKTSAKKQEKIWLEEMSEGIKVPVIKEEKEEDSDNEYKSVNPPVQNKKKDRKQRRKQKEQRALDAARKKAKEEKKKISDIYRIKLLKKMIESNEKLSKKMQEIRKLKNEKKKLETKRLSAHKYEEPELECNMIEDLKGNLRSLKTEGNILIDRFKSLQKRNILEPAVLQMKTKAKKKSFKKASHKMDWEKTDR